jgi:hypothetical protein
VSLSDEWYFEDVDLTAVPLDELVAELDSYMPRDSYFSGYQNLCALWDEYKRRALSAREERSDG